MGETYESAGVSIASGEAAVERIKPAVRSTYRPEVLGDLGSFGGLFDASTLGRRHPILVSTTDGVGTKVAVAAAARRYGTIGIDLVAMCVDDLVCQGAEPLFFLDYLSTGRLDVDEVEQVVAGVAEGCRQAGCALIGGEMAEHPGAMAPGELDLVGFAVGVVERDALVTGEAVAAGDVVVGLPSPNLRSNGFSLARRIYFEVAGRRLDDPAWDDATTTVADELLAPSVVYAPGVLATMAAAEVHAAAHITGGGLAANLARVLPAGTGAAIDVSAWNPPRIFAELQRLGMVTDDEMRRVFNCGIGMVLVMPSEAVQTGLEVLGEHGHDAVVIGEIVAGQGAVRLG